MLLITRLLAMLHQLRLQDIGRISVCLSVILMWIRAHATHINRLATFLEWRLVVSVLVHSLVRLLQACK